MAAKYVPINEVFAEYVSRPPIDWQSTLQQYMAKYGGWEYAQPSQPIVTEEIDCEIVEPKQLPDAG